MSTTEAAFHRVERTREWVDKFHKWRAERELRGYADEQVEEAEHGRDQASRHANGCRRIPERNDSTIASLGEQTPEPNSGEKVGVESGTGTTECTSQVVN